MLVYNAGEEPFDSFWSLRTY